MPSSLRTPRFRRWLASFVALAALVLGWSAVIPLMASPDEPVHAIKAAAVARGQLAGPTEEVRVEDPAVLNYVRTVVDVPSAYADLATMPDCHAFAPGVFAACSPPVSTDETTVTTTTYVGRYQPVYYGIVGLPTLVLPPYRAVWAMRLVSGLMAAALLAAGVAAALEDDRRGALVAGTVLALTPMALYLAASINPSGVEIAAAVAAWPAVVALGARRDRPRSADLAQAAVALGVLALTRPFSPALALGVLGVGLVVGADRARLRTLAGDGRARIAAAFLAVVLAASSLWVVVTGAYDSFTGYPVVGRSMPELVTESLSVAPYRTRQMIGVFGWLDTDLDPVATWLWLGLVAGLVVTALVVGGARARLGLCGLVVALVVLPLTADVVGAAQVGLSWQGRYSLPLAVGLPIVAGAIVDSARRPAPGVVRTGAVAAVVTAATVQLVAVVEVLRRYATGTDEPVTEALTGGIWRGPVPRPVLVAGLAVVLIVGAAALVRSMGRSADDEDEPGARAPAPVSG